MSLRLDWCSHEAAKYAVLNWHYSAIMPRSKMAKIGVWEEGKFIGVVLFGQGSGAATDGRRYGLRPRQEVAELVRVALTRHKAPVSRIVRLAIRMLRSQSPGLKLLISYADPSYGHHGGIYQAMGWVYVGLSSQDYAIVDPAGHRWHSRVVSKKGWKMHYGKPVRAIRPSEGQRIDLPGKYTYLLPLHADVRERITSLALPYPKRAPEASSDAPAIHAGEGGAAPTPALHTEHTEAANG